MWSDVVKVEGGKVEINKFDWFVVVEWMVDLAKLSRTWTCDTYKDIYYMYIKNSL